MIGPKLPIKTRPQAVIFLFTVIFLTASVFYPIEKAQRAAASSVDPLFGFSYPAGYPGWVSAATVAKDMTSLDRSSIIRLTINWSQLQPNCTIETEPGLCVGSPQTPNWSFLDTSFAALHAAGIKVLASVVSAPDWDWNMSDCGTNCTEDLQEYKSYSISMPPANSSQGLSYFTSFVSEFLAHYEGLYSNELIGVEVWNEENSASFWPTMSGPDATRYASLLCAANQGVRSVDTSIPVLFGGLAYGNGTNASGFVDIPTFLDGAYSAGAKACMTAISLHSYPGVEPDISGNPFYSAFSQVRTTDQANGITSIPIWLTEIGYCVTGSSGCVTVTQEQQGYFLECAYQMTVGMPDVAAVIVETLYDASASTQLLGIYQDPSTPRQAVSILTQLFAAYGTTVPAVANCSSAYGWPPGL
ncbi:MAG TPA: hypothetical protein VKV02_01770 [Acidobacteriaceae bacterium]|nr:hypothetical protein [Acidobacteriaceae bacterium]